MLLQRIETCAQVSPRARTHDPDWPSEDPPNRYRCWALGAPGIIPKAKLRR